MQSQKIQIENSGVAAEPPAEDTLAMGEFNTRLEDLRKALQSPAPPPPAPQLQPKSVASRIRYSGWLCGALAFVVTLFIRWDRQATDLTGTIILSVVVSAVFVVLAELTILALPWANKSLKHGATLPHR